MINNVDVSGCKYYEEGFCSRFLNFRLVCEQDVSCDYKQYLFLEQRLEKLKAENTKMKEENYQLQKSCQICENFIDETPCKPLRDMDYDLQKVISQRDNYIKVLEEIREIAQYECTHNCSNDSNNCTIRSCLEKRIQRKINEVLKK